jgi:hypothetical protein
MTTSTVEAVRADALFVSSLQSSDRPAPHRLALAG